jgi:glycine oxidase
VNVVVIGAGIIGAAVAEELASRGARVTVLDMRSPGRGATQASAGMLVPYVEGREHSDLLALCAQSLDLYDDFIRRVRERSGLPIEYSRDGTLEVATDDTHAARLSGMRQWLTEQGIASEWRDAAALREFEPSVTTRAVGGLFIPTQGFVGATALVKALVQSARLNGAAFETPVEVVRVDPAAGGVEIRSDARRIMADAVVVAAGTWSGRVRIAGQPPLPVRPIRGQLLELSWPGGGLPKYPVWGSRVYTVPWQPDTLLVGATMEDVGFDERSTAAGVQELLDGVGELLPGSRQSAVAAIRVGLRPKTDNELPLVGPMPSAPQICLATGHFRNGVLLAPLTARQVADHLMEAI